MPNDPSPLHSPEEHEPEPADPIENPQTRADERRRATFVVPHKLLVAIMLLLIVYLLAAALNIELTIFGAKPGEPAKPTPTRVLSNESAGALTDQSPSIHEEPLPGAEQRLTEESLLPFGAHEIDPLFQEYWAQHDGLRVFGYAISPLLNVDGRRVQWFQRGRLEEWPELAGTPYVFQPGHVGREFTAGIRFPQQQPFNSRPDLWYFPETGHGVGGRFLRFWLERGGVDLFGYPLSEEIREVLSDGQVHTVQYFERARLEYHPQFKDTEYEVMIGLLGESLYREGGRPKIVPESLLVPTPVPTDP